MSGAPAIVTVHAVDLAGEDGIVTDAGVFDELGCRGIPAVTGITVSGDEGVSLLDAFGPAALRRQLEAAASVGRAAVVRTGTLVRPEQVELLADWLRHLPPVALVAAPFTRFSGWESDGRAVLAEVRKSLFPVARVREVRRAVYIQIRKLPCRVESIEKPAPDVAIVKLKLPANERLQFLAGQYFDLLLKDGRRRSFSLATPPHDDALLELHIRHVPGGHFSGQLFNEFKGREILRFEGPLGTFFMREESDKPIIFVAGGSGFAPIKHLELKDPGLSVDVSLPKDTLSFEVSARSLARFVELELDGVDVIFSDNYFDVPAGAMVKVTSPLPNGWTLDQARQAWSPDSFLRAIRRA